MTDLSEGQLLVKPQSCRTHEPIAYCTAPKYRLISIIIILLKNSIVTIIFIDIIAYHDGKYDPQAYASGECPSRNESKDTGV